ncbi:MAG: hypothetical protein L6R40_006964 [Gallowayella cf. fulva]|nr:MAG: hypothetical protein L6R40_006964 [Xanthomendoza cf. fulva]
MATKAPEEAQELRQDALTGEEISGTTIPPSTPSKRQNHGAARNACSFPTPVPPFDPTAKPSLVSELLSPSKKLSPKHKSQPSKSPAPPATTPTTFSGRSGLGAYTAAPESFPSSRVISYNDDFVVINDLYPKSTIHLLLLPRDPKKQLLSPFDALQDPVFLASIQAEVRKLRTLVAKELQRRFGHLSKLERNREEAREKMLSATEELDDSKLPQGRDWSKDVISGIHTHPSMAHLHIHVLSRDRHSECMRHRKHYNSFATEFLVDVEEFPLSEGEVRRRRRAGFLDDDLVCWRCGRGFGNKFAKLKYHLEAEFEEWRSE